LLMPALLYYVQDEPFLECLLGAGITGLSRIFPNGFLFISSRKMQFTTYLLAIRVRKM